MNVLVDSSVFIEFLRGRGDGTLEILLLNNQVLLSQVARLELVAGSRRKEDQVLEKLLSGMRQIPEFPPAMLVQELLMRARGRGLLGGFPDLMLLADAKREKAPLYTLDRKLSRLAEELKIKLFH